MRAVKRFKPKRYKRVFPVLITHTEPYLGLSSTHLPISPKTSKEAILEQLADLILSDPKPIFSEAISNRSIHKARKLKCKERKQRIQNKIKTNKAKEKTSRNKVKTK